MVTRGRQLHVLEDGGGRVRREAFKTSVTFNLDQFKLEVGSAEELVGRWVFCLHLVSGHTKVSFGFESSSVLQVSDSGGWTCSVGRNIRR